MAERERKPGVTIAKEEADETASEVETRRGAFHVSAITKGFSGTLRRRVESLDKDGDGTIDLLELQETLKADYRTHKANKQLKVIILFIFGTLLLSIGATCGTTYAMVSFLKDSEVSDEGVLRSTKSHGPVRTGAARGSVSTSRVDIGAASTAGVRLRRLHQSGNITEAERAPCLNDCPVASTSCTQANKWFDMLKEETTESDVMFKVSTYKTNIVKVRAYEWSVRPATILGYDTDPSWGDSPPSYFVNCPAKVFSKLDQNCSCLVTARKAAAVQSTSDDQPSSTNSTSTRRLLASIMSPDQDHSMAATDGHLELPSLGSLSCARVAEMHDSLQLGKKTHATYSSPLTGYTVPISFELKNTHIVSTSEGSGQELVLSVDVKMSALRADIGHAKIVCPHSLNSTLAWLSEGAAADPDCDCHIYGTKGLALRLSQKLLSNNARSGRSASAEDIPAEDPSPLNGTDPSYSQVFSGRRGLSLLKSANQVKLVLYKRESPSVLPSVYNNLPELTGRDLSKGRQAGDVFDSFKTSFTHTGFLDNIPDKWSNPSPPKCYDATDRRFPPPPGQEYLPWVERPALKHFHESKLKKFVEDSIDTPNGKFTPSIGEVFGYIGPVVSNLVWWSDEDCAYGPKKCSSDYPYLLCGQEYNHGLEETDGTYRIDMGITPDGNHTLIYIYLHYRAAVDDRVDICWRGVGYPQFFGDVASHFATGDADYFTKGDSPGQKFACQHLAYWEAEVVTEDYQPPEEPEETDQLEEECFPASSIMWRRSPVPGSEFPTPVRMDSLRLGDDVMVLNREGKATWAPLLFMAHAYKDIPTVFVELRTISGRSIRASPDHFVMLSTTPKWDNVQALPAKDASIGMYIFSIAQPSKDTHADEKEGKGWRSFAAAVPVLITSVRKVKDTGLFAPVTTSPDAILVVDGFAAHELISMYSMRELSYLKWLVSFLQSLLGPMWFEALHSWLHSHAFTEVFNRIVLTLRYYMHSLVIKA